MSWLTAVAQDLTKRLGPGAVMEQVRPGSYVSTAASMAARPAGSNANLRPLPEGLSLTLPPRGIRRGSSGYPSFGVLWVLMLAAMNAVVYFFMSKGDALPGAYAAITVFMVLFSSVGWGMVGTALHLGGRKIVFELASGRLTLSTRGPFGARRHEWSVADIERIECGPSGRTTNGIPHMALLIRSRGQDPVQNLEERDPVELRWVADVLTKEVARAKSK